MTGWRAGKRNTAEVLKVQDTATRKGHQTFHIGLLSARFPIGYAVDMKRAQVLELRQGLRECDVPHTRANIYDTE